ncbi:type II toxin-antitoxin system Phd/YefM family antitoxin [Mycobacterium intracellulare]|uniref:type II toxin-antitoxin system Phd/YefM family antitoxin n=1 Tax=Mycobacterium intracellulare TaxID=1767 RepID=UPI001EED3B5D|nr:type II toxin-antitoxin system prevent-host-death family antitoxin [Mycobacterium intracellulare]MEE3755464.1 type II toxin-antitoxin system prevent-host-death family antitoxin [Mycobacterium intracellulare]
MKPNSITVRDIRINLDKVLSRIAAGEHLVITQRGHPVAELHPLQPEGRRKREIPPPRHPRRAAVMGEYDRQQRLQAMASAMNAADTTTMDEYRAETAEWEDPDGR